jgi:hypothetical protein
VGDIIHQGFVIAQSIDAERLAHIAIDGDHEIHLDLQRKMALLSFAKAG